MSISPLPTPLQQLSGRRFSFYPPILNIEHNEWMYRRATWSEIVVVNTRSGQEAFIPRVFLGEASLVDDPLVIVGLKRELEWRAGVVCTHLRPVIEMPVAVNASGQVIPHPEQRPGHRPDRKAQVVSIRLETRPEIRTGKKIGVAMVLGAVGCLIVADIARETQTQQRADAFRLSRSYLQITRADDYYSVVRKLGAPAADRSEVQPGNRVFRELSYPNRQFTVVLMGASQPEARYIGTLDTHGRSLDTANLPGGGSTASLLRSAPRF